MVAVAAVAAALAVEEAVEVAVTAEVEAANALEEVRSVEALVVVAVTAAAAVVTLLVGAVVGAAAAAEAAVSTAAADFAGAHSLVRAPPPPLAAPPRVPPLSPRPLASFAVGCAAGGSRVACSACSGVALRRRARRRPWRPRASRTRRVVPPTGRLLLARSRQASMWRSSRPAPRRRALRSRQPSRL